MREINEVLPDLCERLSRTEIIAQLRYEAEAAESSAKRMLRRGGGESASEARRDQAQRIGRILNFLIHDTLLAVPDEPDRTLCTELRVRLHARGEWEGISRSGGPPVSLTNRESGAPESRVKGGRQHHLRRPAPEW